MADHNTTDAVSRRNVLETAAGLLAGSTILAEVGAAATEEGLQMEVREVTEEYIAVYARIPGMLGVTPDAFDKRKVFLGHAERFVIHEDEDAVSLPEDPEQVLGNPVEVEQFDEETYRMYFHTGDIDFSEVEDEEVTLGLGYFPERTMPGQYWDSGPAGEGPDI